MKQYSKKGLEKRKAERECLSEFFIRHVNKIKTEKLHCANCEEQLKGDVSEVAHILPKQYFKSVMCSDENVNYLCSWKSINNCHGKFDNCNDEEFKKMIIYGISRDKVLNLLGMVEEKVSYKLYDRWEIE